MGRSNDFSVSTGAGAQSVINTSLPSGDAIQRGDLVLLGATDNLAYAAAGPNASDLLKTLRPYGGGPAVDNIVLGASTLAAASTIGSRSDAVEFVRLINGNVVTAWVEGGSVAKFAITDQDGGVVASGTLAASILNADGSYVSLVALTAGGFAACYILANQTTAVKLYDAAGNVTVAQFVIDANTTANTVRLTQLANGNIVAATHHGNSVRLAIAKTDGTIVRASSAIYSAPSGYTFPPSSRSIGVVGLAGGGFVIGFCENTSSSGATSRINVYRFDASGSLTGSTNGIATAPDSQNCSVYVVALKGGGYALAYYGINMGASLSIYNASFTLVGVKALLTNTSEQSKACQVSVDAAPNGDVVACAQQGGSALVYRYTAAGVQVGNTITVAATATTTSGGSAGVTVAADNSVLVTVAGGGQASGGNTATIAYLKPDMTLITKWSAPGTAPAYARMWAALTTSSKTEIPSYQFFVQGTGGVIALYNNVPRRQQLTLVGVANYAALIGAPVSIQITGIATLRQAFSQPWTASSQNLKIPGQRFSAIGKTAVMSSFQDAIRYPLN